MAKKFRQQLFHDDEFCQQQFHDDKFCQQLFLDDKFCQQLFLDDKFCQQNIQKKPGMTKECEGEALIERWFASAEKYGQV